MSFNPHRKAVARLSLATALLAAGQTAANAQELDGYVLFSQPENSGSLVRYGFDDNTLDTVGTVTLESGTVVSGIDALAHVPRNTNLFAFWQDPADRLTKLIYVNHQNASATVVGDDLGSGRVTGAVAVKPQQGAQLESDEPTPLNEVQQHQLYGVQLAPTIQFEIDRREVVPQEPFAARVDVLGAAITYGGQYDMPVTVQFMIGGSVAQPFGSLTRALDGNVNDHQNDSRSYVFDETHSAATPISIVARSWTKKRSSLSGQREQDWQPHISVNSNQNSGNVITLRHGDAVPDITPFQNQSSIVSFVEDYIDPQTQTIVLAPNQAIYLFELGTHNLDSSAADFQDLVVLVTLAKNPDELTEARNAPPARLIQIDPRSGDTESVMALSHPYGSLTALTADLFLATFEGKLYRIDPHAQSETLVTASQELSVGELAATHAAAWGLGEFYNNPTLVNITEGQAHDMPYGLVGESLDPIVLVRHPDLPISTISFD